jgi:DNA repair protein RecN (Recombination protein N)
MALKRIFLRDFIIVSELDLELGNGFSVLTGETGAGKSILIDALQLVTGARADAGVVREGAQRTEVCAEFDTTPALDTLLNEAGFEAADPLLLRRTVDTQGKSRAWINGSPATAQQLRMVGEYLLDIHGQHAWQSLTRSDAIRQLLDAYAQLDTQTLALRWSDWRAARAALEEAVAQQASRQREREQLLWQIETLEKLNPQADEWPELNAAHSRLANGQSLLEAALAAVDLLQDGENSTLQALHGALQPLTNLVNVEPEFDDPITALHNAIAQIEDAVHTLRSYARGIEPDPDRLAELDARMGEWISLARKYRQQPEELHALLSSWKQALKTLDAASDMGALEEAERSLRRAFDTEARKVSKARTTAAPKLAAAISAAMQGLGMEGGQFQVQLEPLSTPQQSGLEDVQFLVAGHAGSTPRPVSKVASGGELSRLALAIAVTTSQLGTAHTLIFDEVDSGVGGAVAATVGRLMKKLGIDRQVLAVTHLPQVAAFADHHLKVAKQLQGKATVSDVAPLAADQRPPEIARMLGGDTLSPTTLAHAREMLQSANANL